MEGPRMLKYERFHSLGGHKDTPTLEQLKVERVEALLSMQPILARFIADHLIEYDENTKLKWKDNLVQELDIAQLIMLTGVLENKKEQEQRTY